MYYDINGNIINDNIESLITGSKIKASTQFYFTGANADSYGDLGIVVAVSDGDTYYCNFAPSTNDMANPKMLQSMPKEFYEAITIGVDLIIGEDGGYTAKSDGAIFFPIVFTKGSTAENYLANGNYSTRIVQNIPFETVDAYYSLNYAENIVFNALSPLSLSTMLKNFSDLHGANVCVIGDSLVEQSAGNAIGATANDYGFKIGTKNGYGWMSRIARKYNIAYYTHGYGMQCWWSNTDRPNGGTKAVKSLLEWRDSTNSDCPNFDIFILNLGTNDIWSWASYFGEYSDVADETTQNTVSAMRYVVETIQSNFPSARIIVILPCMRNNNGLELDKQKEYRELAKQVLSDYSVEWIDMYTESGIIASMLNPNDFVHLASVNDDNSYNNDKESVRRYSKAIERKLIA